ncbi:S41 family peptidase [Romboutsia sp. Marseille-P6047]|uniref:S41 family peptidase n=1 Tax=Romboutsia sp. Marseille-P6047 TaxID=2161817 RepID=UPI00082220EA|nr:S41 family peptidase [Romboutsia sp. Marseille-P6047]SCI36490.1 Probable CtpA-like serine protease [uncultured Clostridium sp.]
MISKKKAIIGSIVLVVVTAILTSTVQLALGNKVVISKDLYESYKKYNKLIGLQQIVGEDFYQEVSEDDLVQGAIKGMFSGLDDIYSQYYTKEEFEQLKEQTSGSFVGIGVYISATSDDDYITIIAPIEGSPAEKGGIKSGDKIIKVDDQNVYANESDKAISMIKGKAGTNVKLTVKRGEEEFELTIKREEIVSKSVESKVLDDNMGYLKITSFNENTYDEFKEDLESLKEKNIKGLVLDLRNNPGGLLDICADIADDLIGEGTIVYTKDNKDDKEYLKSDKNKLGLPIAVLVNGGSASASEILTAAIVDNNEGIAIGTTTFGKGLVQSVRELKDGTGYKLTTAQYFTPNGDYINGKGIEPKIVEEDERKQLDVAVEWIKQQLK